jgi:hypothetical protein
MQFGVAGAGAPNMPLSTVSTVASDSVVVSKPDGSRKRVSKKPVQEPPIDAEDIFDQLTLGQDKSEDWTPDPLVSKDTAFRQAVYSELSSKKKINSRALPFLQRTIEDACRQKDITDFSSFSTDELVESFIRGCIIDYFYGAGSMYNAWKAVYLHREGLEVKKDTEKE